MCRCAARSRAAKLGGLYLRLTPRLDPARPAGASQSAGASHSPGDETIMRALSGSSPTTRTQRVPRCAEASKNPQWDVAENPGAMPMISTSNTSIPLFRSAADVSCSEARSSISGNEMPLAPRAAGAARCSHSRSPQRRGSRRAGAHRGRSGRTASGGAACNAPFSGKRRMLPHQPGCLCVRPPQSRGSQPGSAWRRAR